MKRFLLSPQRTEPSGFDYATLILRVGSALFMLYGHGWPKFQKLLAGGPYQFADPLGIGTDLSFILVTIAEFFCAILVMIGFYTRVSLIPLVFAMAVAAFIAQAGDPFLAKEKALMFFILFVALLMTGPGKYSLDAMMSKSK